VTELKGVAAVEAAEALAGEAAEATPKATGEGANTSAETA
jgi:hypothetical protein